MQTVDSELAWWGDISRLAQSARQLQVFEPCRGTHIATGTTNIFCGFGPGEGWEGVLLGLNFYWEAEDYVSSPVSVVTMDANSWAQGTGALTQGTPLGIGLTFNAPVSRDRFTLAYFPRGWGAYFSENQSVGLQLTNNDPIAATYYAEGRMAGFAWPSQFRVEQEQAGRLAQLGGNAPWTKGGKLFQKNVAQAPGTLMGGKGP